MSAAGSLQVLSPNYVTFVIFIFANSLGTAGVYPLAFIIGMLYILSTSQGERKKIQAISP